MVRPNEPQVGSRAAELEAELAEARALLAQADQQSECAAGLARGRSHCRFRNRGTEYFSESGVKWMSGSTKRQCD